jgi:Histidine kinase
VIPPAGYQTNWFIALCVAAFLALLWGLYQLRLRLMAKQFNMRLEERVGERTRIARDLHDTLLQSFHGVLLYFQTGINLLPKDAEPGSPKLGRHSTKQCIRQSMRSSKVARRSRVCGLRYWRLTTLPSPCGHLGKNLLPMRSL